MEAGEYGLKRGTFFVARRPELVAVAGLMWISWCVLGAAGFVFSMILRFKIRAHDLWLRGPRAVDVDSVKRLRQSASLLTEHSRLPIPTSQVYHLLCSYLRIMASVDQ